MNLLSSPNKIFIYFKKTFNELNTFFNSKAGSAIKIFFSLSIVFYFIISIDISQIKKTILNFNTEFLIILILFINIRVFLGGIRFYFMIYPFNQISITTLTKHYYIGFMFNNLLPTSIGGDAVRVFLLSKEASISKKKGFTLIVIERLIGLYVLIILSFIFSFFADIPSKIMFFTGLIFIISSVFILFYKKILYRFRSFKIIEKLTSLLTILQSSYKRLFLFFLFCLLFQIVSILLVYLIALAFDFIISPLPFFVFVPLIWLFTLIPISFGGVGLREIAFIYLFSMIGLEKEQSFILSLGTYFSFVITGIIGGFIYLKDNIIHQSLSHFKKSK